MILIPELVLAAYETGYFPMAESQDATDVLWFNPDPRAIIPLDEFHIPKSLKKTVRQEPYKITVDQAFRAVMEGCSEPRGPERECWINPAILNAYCELHELGHAHSIECWHEEQLVGGLYGVSLGAAFFGESMFSRMDDASKITLVYLLEIMLRAEYELLDTQYVNDHLQQFGVTEIPRTDYLGRLMRAQIASPNPSHHFSQWGMRVSSMPPYTFKVMEPSSSRSSW